MTPAEAIADVVENICIAATVLGCVWMWIRLVKE
jgi:hypothetical protein